MYIKDEQAFLHVIIIINNCDNKNNNNNNNNNNNICAGFCWDGYFPLTIS